MRHYVAYHNSQSMGYTAEESRAFSVYTRKKICPLGDVVWVIAGKGKSPKQFYLSSWFVVSAVEPADHSDFSTTLSGKEGGVLDPMPLLKNGREWFVTLFKRTRNFSLGLSEITTQEVVNGLRELAEASDCPAP